MIICCTLLLALILALSGIVVILMFKPKWAWLNRVIIAMIVLALICGIFAIIGNVAASIQMKDLIEDHETLLTYFNAVEYSENEYMRFDYYNRVNDFNERYNTVIEQSNSLWVGWFYDLDLIKDIGPVDFYLRGGM
jgi:ABC-type transport system involved in Fe-S cluster assembly fused permease/ATPase subunit